MKNRDKKINVKFRGVVDFTDGENAPLGTCERLVNARQRHDALQVVGRCQLAGTLAEGEQLMTVHGVSSGAKHLISSVGNVLRWHGTAQPDGTVAAVGATLATAASAITAVQGVGDFLVAATAEGALLLRYDAPSGTYSRLDPQSAVPRLLICTSGAHAISTAVDSYAFAQPLTHWQRPLATTDEERITTLLADAHERLQRRAQAQGYYTQPLLARYAVRLWDDSYLWVSAPVLVGPGVQTLGGSTTAVTDGTTFSGINGFTASIQAFRVGVVVESGSGAEWDGLVKAIDILTTDESDPIAAQQTADYTMDRTTTGTVAYRMDLSLPTQSGKMVQAWLLDGGKQWHVACSIYDMALLRQGVVNAANCSLSANATGLPSGVRRYEVEGVGTPTVATATLDRCATASARSYAMAAMGFHNRRLMAAPGEARLVNPWHPSQFWHGTLAGTSCRIVVEASIATAAGTATTVWQGEAAFTPEALSPIVSYPDSRATSVTISLLPSGGTVMSATVTLHSVPGCNMASNASDGLQPVALATSTTDMLAVPQEIGTAEALTGQIVEYEELNPLVVAQWHSVCDTAIKAIAATAHHANNVIGTPLYIFAADGVYALPYRVASAQYSPAVLLSRQVIAHGAQPADGDQAVYFATHRGDVCQIKRYQSQVVLQGQGARALAWNFAEDELWILTDGGVEVLQPDCGLRYSRRDAQYERLAHLSATAAYAITSDGQLLDITREEAQAAVDVELLTYPFAIDAMPRCVTWRVFASRADVSIAVLGDSGASCHGATLCKMRVSGCIAAPLPMRMVSPPVRVLRLALVGTLPAGAVLRGAVIF